MVICERWIYNKLVASTFHLHSLYAMHNMLGSSEMATFDIPI